MRNFTPALSPVSKWSTRSKVSSADENKMAGRARIEKREKLGMAVGCLMTLGRGIKTRKKGSEGKTASVRFPEGRVSGKGK